MCRGHDPHLAGPAQDRALPAGDLLIRRLSREIFRREVASKDTKKSSEMPEDVEDRMTLSSSSVTEMMAKRQRTENPDLPPTCQVTRNNKTSDADLLICIC